MTAAAYEFVIEVYSEEDLIATQKGALIASAIYKEGLFSRLSGMKGITPGGYTVRRRKPGESG